MANEHEHFYRDNLRTKLKVDRLTDKRLIAHLESLGLAREPFENRLLEKLNGNYQS